MFAFLFAELAGGRVLSDTLLVFSFNVIEIKVIKSLKISHTYIEFA